MTPTEARKVEAATALREFLRPLLNDEELRTASKLIAGFVAASLNDHGRIVAEREAAERRRQAAIDEAVAHYRKSQVGAGLGDIFSSIFHVRRPPQ